MLFKAGRRQSGITPSDSIKFFRPCDGISGRIPLPTPYLCQTLGFRKLRLSELKNLFHMLALGNVYRHPQHTFGFTVARVVEFSFSSNPAHTFVWPENAELRRIRLVALHCGVHCSRD